MTVTIAAKAFDEETRALREALMLLARLDQVLYVDDIDASDDQVTTITPDGIEVAVRLGDVIDVTVERTRLEKEIDRLRDDMARAERKLGNEEFVGKAPASVVEKERRKLAEASEALSKLESRLRDLG
jgi:valyl-tRNA synthetase